MGIQNIDANAVIPMNRISTPLSHEPLDLSLHSPRIRKHVFGPRMTCAEAAVNLGVEKTSSSLSDSDGLSDHAYASNEAPKRRF
jgi:hypothetical protein